MSSHHELSPDHGTVVTILGDADSRRYVTLTTMNAHGQVGVREQGKASGVRFAHIDSLRVEKEK